MAWIDEIKQALKENPGKSVGQIIPIARERWNKKKANGTAVSAPKKAKTMKKKASRAMKKVKRSMKKAKRSAKRSVKKAKRSAKRKGKKAKRSMKKGKRGGECGSCNAPAPAPVA